MYVQQRSCFHTLSLLLARERAFKVNPNNIKVKGKNLPVFKKKKKGPPQELSLETKKLLENRKRLFKYTNKNLEKTNKIMELRKKFPQTTFFKHQREIKKGIAKKPENITDLEIKLKDQKGDLIDASFKSRIYFPYGSEKLKRLRLVEKDSKLKIAEKIDLSHKMDTFNSLRILPTTRKLINDLIINDTVLKQLKQEDIKCSDIQMDTIYKMSKKIYTPESKQYLRDLTERQKQQHLKEIALKQNITTGDKVEDLVIEKLLRNEEVNDITVDEVTSKKLPELQAPLVKPIFNNKVIEENSKYAIYNTNIFTIAAETGSGKTIGYLAPLLDYLQIYKNHLEEENLLKKKDPIIRSVIFQPSNELILQVYNFLTLNHKAPLNLNIVKLDSSVSPIDMVRLLKKSKERPIDILICSPDKLGKSLLKYDSTLMKHLANHLEWCIIDESDSLLDLNGSLKELTFFLNRCKRLNTLVTCSATISELFLKNLKQLQIYQSNIERHFIVTTNNLHKVNKNLKLYNIDCSLKPFLNDRLKCVQQIIYSIYQKNKKDYENEPYLQKVFNRIIIFVNKKTDVEILAEYLKKESNFANVYGITSELSLEERNAAIKPFIEVPDENETEIIEEEEEDDDENKPILTKNRRTYRQFIADSNISIPAYLINNEGANGFIKQSQNSEMQILITTDLLSRGLNFKKIKNLILFSPPKTSSDFIHRCGRICRLGDVGYSKNYYNSQIRAENNNKNEEGGRVYMITDKKETKQQWIRELGGVIKKGKSFV